MFFFVAEIEGAAVNFFLTSWPLPVTFPFLLRARAKGGEEEEKGNDWLPILESHACYWEPICSSLSLGCNRRMAHEFLSLLLSLTLTI